MIILLIINYNNKHEYKKLAPKCPRPLYGPVDIQRPLKYMDFSLSVELNNINQSKIIKIDELSFVIEQNMGYIYYGGNSFKIERMYFKFPSDTTIGGWRFSLEIILEGNTKNNKFIQVSKLYENHPHITDDKLDQFDFDILSKMKNYEYQTYRLLKLDKLLNNEKDYFLYEGQSINNKCRIGMIALGRKVGYVSHKILDYFGINKGGYNKKDMKLPKNLFQNFFDVDKENEYVGNSFIKGINIYKINGFDKNIIKTPSYLEADFPVDIVDQSVMYQNYKGILGTIPKFSWPFWIPITKKVDYLPEPIVHENYKAMPLFFLPSKYENYLPVYVIVPRNTTLIKNTKPNSLIFLIRSNYKLKNDIRLVNEINVPLVLGNNTLIENLNNNKNNTNTTHNYKLYQQLNKKPKKTNINEKNIKSYNKSRGFLRESIVKYCERKKLHDIVNIPYNDLKAWERYHLTMKKFKNQRTKCVKTFEFKLKHVLSNSGNNKKKKISAKIYTRNLKHLLKFCKNQLFLILNRNMVKDMTDYVEHNCNGKILKNKNDLKDKKYK